MRFVGTSFRWILGVLRAWDFIDFWVITENLYRMLDVVRPLIGNPEHKETRNSRLAPRAF